MDPISKFGIVQGRLTKSPKNELQYFPSGKWENEFSNANMLGFNFIELLVEKKFNNLNPIWSADGRNQIKSISKICNMEIYSICTDYIIENKLIGKDNQEAHSHLRKIIEIAKELNCKTIILPLLEANNLDKDNYLQYLPIIKDLSYELKDSLITVSIECLLEAEYLKNLLDNVNADNIKCVFDTGNRINYSQNISDEILTLNKHINHVHIKDKNKIGENVILGTGLVNFYEVFNSLYKIHYIGPYVFETTRGKDPLSTAEYHLNLCKFFLSEVSND